jgi:uncharacterized protein (TIGR03382 family)
MTLGWFPIIGLVAGCAVDPQSDLHVDRRPSELAISIATTGRAVDATRTRRGPLRRLDHDRIPELPDRAGRAGAPDANIVGGTRHSGNPEVAFLLAFDAQDESLGTCTGTLIAPTAVLTAAHCIDIPDAAGFLVYFGSDASVEVDPGALFLTYAESVVEHPDWDPDTLENDIGLMFLEDPVPIVPAQLRTAPLARTDLGEPVHLVGWGITGGGEEDGGVKRHVVSELFDFDQTLVEVGAPEANTCSGDSGGPAFLERDGVEELIGVTSFGDTDCVLDGFSTRVDSFLDFIASGGTGGGGGVGTGDVGAPCVDGEECVSGVCLLTSDGDGVCTDLCSESSDCPTGFGCAAIDEIQVCIPATGGGTGGDLGDACTDDGQCASDLCAPSIEGGGVCSQLCDEATSCGAGFSCEPVVGGSICLASHEDDSPPPPAGDAEAEGCSAAGTSGGGLLPLLVLFGLAAARRRRR